MVNVAKVRLYDKELGTIHWIESRQVAEFEYSQEFISTGIEPSPIIMPVSPGRVYSFPDLGKETFKGLPGLIADALPDTYGRVLFDRWLALTGRTSGNPIETLCYLGKRSMGALEFEPAIEPDHGTAAIEIPALVDVANTVLSKKSSFATNLKQDKKAAIAEIVRLGTSAGGQRAKAIIAYNRETGEVRSGQVPAPPGFEYYLLKLDGVNGEAGLKETQNYGRLEYSFYQLARKSGIEMSDSYLLEENGRAHFLTKRFDRTAEGKIHTQTLCGLAHYDFHFPKAYSYEQAFNVMRSIHLPYSDAIQMFRRMIFNVIIRNQDDHTKNISFLMNRNGRWSLSPAYDMMYAYNPAGDWTSQHQMSINGKFDEITRKDLVEFALKNNIEGAEGIITELSESIKEWPIIAKSVGVPEGITASIYSHFQFL